jgi:hypothetical protein
MALEEPQGCPTHLVEPVSGLVSSCSDHAWFSAVRLLCCVQGVAPSGMRDKATGQPVLAAEARAIQVRVPTFGYTSKKHYVVWPALSVQHTSGQLRLGDQSPNQPQVKGGHEARHTQHTPCLACSAHTGSKRDALVRDICTCGSYSGMASLLAPSH